jgi:hypothetical protein
MADMICHKVYELLMSILNIFNVNVLSQLMATVQGYYHPLLQFNVGGGLSRFRHSPIQGLSPLGHAG